jgi:ribosomal protein S18 acetylase RimI-like enzyme
MDRSNMHRDGLKSELNGIQIRQMLAGDMDAACELIGLAFADNPNTLTVASGNRAKARQMTQAAVRVAKLGRKYSHVLIAEDRERLVGVLNAVDWPHCQMRAGEKLKTVLAVLPAMGLALARQLKISKAWAKRDPSQPHWHLGPIAVRPEFQGSGVGKAMLASFLGMADEQSLPSYLETDLDRNVALYEKFGFKVMAREHLMGIDNRFMWRTPQPSSRT